MSKANTTDDDHDVDDVDDLTSYFIVKRKRGKVICII